MTNNDWNFGTKWYIVVHVGTKMVIKWGSMVHRGANYLRDFS